MSSPVWRVGINGKQPFWHLSNDPWVVVYEGKFEPRARSYALRMDMALGVVGRRRCDVALLKGTATKAGEVVDHRHGGPARYQMKGDAERRRR